MREYSRTAVVMDKTPAENDEYVAKLELQGALYVTDSFSTDSPYKVGQTVTLKLGTPEDWIEDHFHSELVKLPKLY